MIKKKYLFPDSYFADENPHLIASLVGPGYLCATLFDQRTEKGGMVLFSAETVDTGSLLDEEANNPILEDTVSALTLQGIQKEGLSVNLFGTEYDETALQPGQLEFTLDKIASGFKEAGIGDVNCSVEQFPGIKIYFKNWDNSLRVTESVTPAYCSRDEDDNSKIKILVVDDSSLVQNILLRTLKQDDRIDVVGTASDVFLATEMIFEKDPDVILLDIIMPQINGLNYLQELMQYYPKAVVVFSTLGKDGGNVQKQALEFGAVDVMDKRKLNLSDQNSIAVIQEKIKAAFSMAV